MIKKYNHAFTIAFSLYSQNDGENVTKEELLLALKKRVVELENTGEIDEACGLPFDTYENPGWMEAEINRVSERLNERIENQLSLLEDSQEKYKGVYICVVEGAGIDGLDSIEVELNEGVLAFSETIDPDLKSECLDALEKALKSHGINSYRDYPAWEKAMEDYYN